MKILYATDGLASAHDAGALIERCARRDSDVTVLSIAYSGVPAPEHAIYMLDPLPDRRKDAVLIVDAATERLHSAGFNVTGRVEEGHPARLILDRIAEDWYDLTVVGSGNRSWVGGKLLGSVSSHLLHSSPSSVLIAHEAQHGKARAEVLLATDGSRGAEKALYWFTRFADPERCRVTTFCVGPEAEAYFYGVPGTIPPSGVRAVRSDLDHRSIRHAELLAEGAAERLRSEGFQAEAHVALGSPVEQILKQSESGDFDLVVVGSRGLGAMRRALVGSVSDQIARHSKASFVARRFVNQV